MKSLQILDINKISMRDILNDETIFVLHDQYDVTPYSKGTKKNLRCSCRPLRNMKLAAIDNIMSHPDDYIVIKIEPSHGNHSV